MTAGEIVAQSLSRSVNKPMIASIGGGLAPVEQPTRAAGCTGEDCAWFIKNVNEKGETIGGSCAMALHPLALNQVGQLMNSLLGTIMGVKKS